jgi:quercetin dioxygenase-like cupin family protein
MADGYFITSQVVPQVTMSEGINRRTMAVTDEAMLCEFFLERGSVVKEHHHMNDQVGYIVFGRLEMTIGGQTRILYPGDSYAIPGGVLHSTVAVIDTLAIDVFSPPRNDYRTEAR